MTNSLRKYIRREKARIRREVLNLSDQQALIKELYLKNTKSQKNDNSGNIQSGDK